MADAACPEVQLLQLLHRAHPLPARVPRPGARLPRRLHAPPRRGHQPAALRPCRRDAAHPLLRGPDGQPRQLQPRQPQGLRFPAQAHRCRLQAHSQLTLLHHQLRRDRAARHRPRQAVGGRERRRRCLCQFHQLVLRCNRYAVCRPTPRQRRKVISAPAPCGYVG